MKPLKILVFGAGVIGSLYAATFSDHGHEVSVFARGKRLRQLQACGLRYRKNNQVLRSDVEILDTIPEDAIYDFIFLTVRSEQVKDALVQLRENASPTIVTMVNTAQDQREWEELCGKGKILPAFPGAGGGITEDGILDAAFTPALLQPTTFGELDGRKTVRLQKLKELFSSCRIPSQIVPNMHAWQISHLALVVPLADAYYMSEDPANVYADRKIMKQTAETLRSNFLRLQKKGMLSPFKFHVICFCPVFLMTWALSAVYRSDFAEVFMYRHAMKAPQEMEELKNALIRYV